MDDKWSPILAQTWAIHPYCLHFWVILVFLSSKLYFLQRAKIIPSLNADNEGSEGEGSDY